MEGSPIWVLYIILPSELLSPLYIGIYKCSCCQIFSNHIDICSTWIIILHSMCFFFFRKMQILNGSLHGLHFG